jgi:hypothetical protein
MPISLPDFDRIDESDLQELRTKEVAEGIAPWVGARNIFGSYATDASEERKSWRGSSRGLRNSLTIQSSFLAIAIVPV